MKLNEAAMNYIGVPYAFRSYNPTIGLDCATFLHHAIKDSSGLIIHIPLLPSDFGIHKENPVYEEILSRHFVGANNDSPQPGDILLFKYGRSFCHAGVAITTGMIIHCTKERGVHISPIPDREYKIFRGIK